jgi:hypothetical protein
VCVATSRNSSKTGDYYRTDSRIDRDPTYQHIDALFTQVVDWNLIGDALAGPDASGLVNPGRHRAAVDDPRLVGRSLQRGMAQNNPNGRE